MNLMIIIKSSPEERKKIREALRLCAEMIGMYEYPYVVFRSQSVECLKKGVIEDAEIAEYLQTVSDLVGVYYLKELNVGESEKISELYARADELVRIMTKSVLTAKKNKKIVDSR